MNKPIVVCGVDFSGTSMVAGMLEAAGIDMGDTESAEEVAILDRPVKYRTFEDRYLKQLLDPLAAQQIQNLPDITHAWIENLYVTFMEYLESKANCGLGKPSGYRWGVKNNGLIFLAMHEKFDEIPVQWITTGRGLRSSMFSAFNKLGRIPNLAALMGVEYMAWLRFIELADPSIFPYKTMIRNPRATGYWLAHITDTNLKLVPEISNFIDLETKGVIHGMDHRRSGVG